MYFVIIFPTYFVVCAFVWMLFGMHFLLLECSFSTIDISIFIYQWTNECHYDVLPYLNFVITCQYSCLI